MKKVMVLLKAMLILLFLTSCASHGTTVPKAFIGSAEIFQVDDTGTVKVKGYNLKNQPTHWAFVHCDYWSGCYMRCQGPKKICKSIAVKSDLKVINFLTNH
jgi:carbonic anhydrase